ncbi:hypothetical protein E4U39_007233 [Claviceps sp. Clav50 group G5]|nr:hypothetical protein E4U39_007233 [Claviceps sp. Clav50 group G5]
MSFYPADSLNGFNGSVRTSIVPRLARGSVDVDQPSDSRSLHPVTNVDELVPSPTSEQVTSQVLSALDLSPPHDLSNQAAESAPASTANIESSYSRPGASLGQTSQVLGRRRRSSGPSSLPEDLEPTSTSLDTAAIDTVSISASPNPAKRRRFFFSIMESEATSSAAGKGSAGARPHGSIESASQSAASLEDPAHGSRKAAASSAAMGSSSRGNRAVSEPLAYTYFGHDREEVTRILIQALSDMGYQAAAESVSQVSGHKLESPTVAAFRSAVLEGSWIEAEKLLNGATISGQGSEQGGRGGYSAQEGNGLLLSPGSNIVIMRFWLRQQKFLELLERRDTANALQVLRNELTPLHHDTGKLHLLSSLLMCLSTNELMTKANWDGARGESRRRLLIDLSSCISPSVMLPEGRLAVLLQQVKQSQINNCIYHTAASSPSLYSDHICDRSNFPTEVVLELPDAGMGEVWEVQFSHDGSKLASCGSTNVVSIWETQTFMDSASLVIHVQKDHESGVASIAWSPNDQMLVTCSRDNYARVWDPVTGSLIKKLPRFDEPVSACVWAADGASFILGTLDSKRSICTFDMARGELFQWNKKHRVQALSASLDGRWLVAADNMTTIYVYNGQTRELEYELDLGTQPTSLSISQDCRSLLVNKADSEAQLIDLVTRTTIHKFHGHKMDRFIIRSTFGGANESFVVSGSEDGCMFIWHKSIGAAVERLSGHTKRCNGATWNPADPCMIASCSDEGPIKIWSNRARAAEFRNRPPGNHNGWRPPSDIA